MRTLVLFIFFLHLLQVAQGQNHELDSLYQVLENHPQEDTSRVVILLKLCNIESNSEPEKAKQHAEEALRISQKDGFIKGTAGSYRFVSSYYLTIGEHGKATEFAYKMLQTYETISFPIGIGQAYQLLGRINVAAKGDPGKSESLYLKALHYFEEANSKLYISSAYNSLGVINSDNEKNEQAITYFSKSLAIRKELGDKKGIGQSYVNLAQVYTKMQKFQIAIDYFEQGLHIFLERADHYSLIGIYAGMGELYTYKSDYTKAESYLLKSIEEAKMIGQKQKMVLIYDLMAYMEKSRKRYDAQADYLELKNQYKDSIYNEQRVQQMAEFETRFEVAKKNQAIALLERDQRIKRLWIDILIASVFLLILISIAIYAHQRYRERKNRQILNLEIDNLTAQHKEMSERYRKILSAGNETPPESLDQQLLKKAIDVIEENIDNSRFSVEELADKLHMSRTHLHRKMKAITNFPPSELIRTIRLRKAATLLINQSNTVSQVGIMVGFDDHSHFSRSFKKQFGVSPSEYMQSLAQTP